MNSSWVKWVPLAVVAAALLLVVGMLFIRITPPVPPDSVVEMMTACSGGTTSSLSSGAHAKLTSFFSGISAGTKVSSSTIGVITDKISPMAPGGLAVYKAYTDCLKEQMAIAVSQRGGVVVQDEVQIEEEKEKAEDATTVSLASEITPNTPSSRLEQIFGQPISDTEYPDEHARIVRYQYKTLLYAFEYYRRGKRLGIVIATSSNDRGDLGQLHKSVDGWPTMTLGDTLECGDYDISAHFNAISSTCGGSHAENYVYTTYLFDDSDNIAPLSNQDDKDIEQKCVNQDQNSDDFGQFEKSKCPGLAKIKAMAAAISMSNTNSKVVGESFLDDLDFGSDFKWPASN